MQTQIGGGVLGTVSSAATFSEFEVAGQSDTHFDRSYSIQVVVEPEPACTPLPPDAVNGYGTVTCNGLYCTLQCDEGYGSAHPTQTCQNDGSWTIQGDCKLRSQNAHAWRNLTGVTRPHDFVVFVRV